LHLDVLLVAVLAQALVALAPVLVAQFIGVESGGGLGRSGRHGRSLLGLGAVRPESRPDSICTASAGLRDEIRRSRRSGAACRAPRARVAPRRRASRRATPPRRPR